jgi:phage shock protein A
MTENPAGDPNPVPAEPAATAPEPDYTEAGVPTFDHVRDRIENRFATATGAAELAGLGTEHDLASLDKKIAERDQAARDKLAEIRRSMRGE